MTKTLLQLAREYSERTFGPLTEPPKLSLRRRILKRLSTIKIGSRKARNIRIVTENLERVINTPFKRK